MRVELLVTMRYMNHNPSAVKKARGLRQKVSIAEEILWERLRGSKTGYKFRRQFPIDKYVLDFYCAGPRLCVEVDGEIHESRQEEDWIRDGVVLSNGIRTIRFSSKQCMEQPGAVVQVIIEECKSQIAAGCVPRPRTMRVSS